VFNQLFAYRDKKVVGDGAFFVRRFNGPILLYASLHQESLILKDLNMV
jgi:hypothetical protein